MYILFHDYSRHLYQLHGALSVFQGLLQVQDLAAHHAHLFVEVVPVEALILLQERIKR